MEVRRSRSRDAGVKVNSRKASARRPRLLANTKLLTHPELGLDWESPQLSQSTERQRTSALRLNRGARVGAERLTLGSVGLLLGGTGGSTVRVNESDEAVALAREDLVELDRGRLGRGDLDGGLLLGGGAVYGDERGQLCQSRVR